MNTSHPNISSRQPNTPKITLRHMESPKYGYFRSNYFIRLYIIVVHGYILIHLAQAILFNRDRGGGYLDHIKD